MKNETITVFLIDDEFPANQDMVNKGVFESGISSENLYNLTKIEKWRGLHFLQNLIINIVESKEFKNELINLVGYKNPSIALDAIEKGVLPNVVIYDWEYGMPNPVESQNFLLEILKLVPNTFVFVYSKVRDEIPQFLNKSIFDAYARQFQLFRKDDVDNSIFSSEEFILQYLLTRVSNNPTIFIGGKKLNFLENGYLSKPNDILHIENLLGKQTLISKLQMIDSFTNESIEQLLNDDSQYFLFDKTTNYLIASDATHFIEKFQPSVKMTLLDVIKQFGLKKLNTVLESGITKI